VKSILKRIFNIVFPPKCISCKEILPYYSEDLFCDKCLERWKSEKETKCRICGKAIAFCRCTPESCKGVTEMLISVAPYTSSGSVTDNIVLYAKDCKDKELFKFMAREMSEAAYAEIPSTEDVIVTYVPRSHARKNETGHDQSEYLAKYVAEIFSLKTEKIFRKRGKIQQKTLGAEERATNAESSYVMYKNAQCGVNGKTFILCDDVVTTGASLSVCAKALLSAGAERVYALTFAKTVKK